MGLSAASKKHLKATKGIAPQVLKKTLRPARTSKPLNLPTTVPMIKPRPYTPGSAKRGYTKYA